ncbi:MAG: hypothetical protein LBV32_07795 [Tannerellaceae bacterium]|jgi:regulator of cell morphogenesis and NO signaling|nr:hypothetical protein [Tannerellaceae bacterium]
MKFYTHFTETIKLVDLVRTNYRLLDVLPRFGVGLGFQERTIKQICEEKKISPAVFLLVCNVYTFDDYSPDEQVFNDIFATELLAFLSASHRDYLRMQAGIFAKVVELSEISSDLYRKVMVDLGTRYQQLLQDHIDYEEQVEFPYIRELINTKSPQDVCRPQIEDQDRELHVFFYDFQSLILKYLTDDSMATSRLYRDVLVSIAMFKMDTDKHILLKDIFMTAMERMTNLRL